MGGVVRKERGRKSEGRRRKGERKKGEGSEDAARTYSIPRDYNC